MRGRVRVGGGQPEVQGHDPRLQAEADEREHEEGARRGGPARAGRERPQLERARRGPEPAEEREQDERPGVGRDEVHPARLLHLGPLVLGGDEQEGGERHDLPGEEEGDAVRREHDARHRRDQEAEAEAELPPVLRVLRLPPVARAVERARRAERVDGHQEEGRERVEPQVERELGERAGERSGLDASRAPVRRAQCPRPRARRRGARPSPAPGRRRSGARARAPALR